MEKLLNSYLEYLLYQRNYSKYTIENYKEDIMLFNEYLNKESLDFLDITYQDVRLFFNFLEEKKFEKTTIARHISSLRNFYKYLVRNNYINSNPFELVSSPKKDKLLPKFLYQNEIEELFLIPDLNDPLGIRNRLILELLYATGMRVGECEYIKLNDINFKEQSIKILGKGNKERYVYYGRYAKTYLELYLEKSRPILNKNNSEYLLLNKNGTRLTSRGIRLILDKIIEKSSLKVHISPHTLRHTFATHLLEAGCDILSVQELLGHESLKATQIYTHITNENLKKVYMNAHPRSGKKIEWEVLWIMKILQIY